MRKYTKDHEWVELSGNIVTVGITDYAQNELGDVVFVDLPAIGKEVSSGDVAAVVESVKAASDIYAPLDGKILEINELLAADSALVNSDAEGKGWLFRMELKKTDQWEALLDKTGYDALLG